jgi:hypothetical protein
VSLFGKILFTGSKFVRWTLIPILVLSAVLWTWLARDISAPDFKTHLFLHLMCGLPILLAIGLLDTHRFRWVFRVVTAIVFAIYCWYAVDEFLSSGEMKQLHQARSEPALRDAVEGLVVIGIPCLIYTIFGQFTPRKKYPLASASTVSQNPRLPES